LASLLILPVLAIFLIAPSLGSYAAERSGASVSALVNSNYPPRHRRGDPVPLSVLDYATRAVFEQDAALKDRTVKLTDFISKREGGGVRLTRMI
jgi:hypothetical protein